MSEASPTSEENLSEEEKQPLKKRAKKIQKQKKKDEVPKEKESKDQSSEETEEEKPKKKGGRKAKKADHPRTIDMITEAIENLEDKNGSSVQAIKSYINNNFKVREDMIKSMIKRALVSALKDNIITRPKNQINNTQLLSGRYIIRPKSAEEIEPPKPRPSKLRQLSVLKKAGQKTKTGKKKKKRRKGFY